MNSIFIRIYGGMLGALLVVALLFLLIVRFLAADKTEAVRMDLARGTLELLADAAVEVSPDKRDRWLSHMSQRLDWTIELLSESHLNLSGSELRALKSERVRVSYDDDKRSSTLYAVLPAKAANDSVEQSELTYLRAFADRVGEQQARATMMLLMEHLIDFPIEKWSVQLAELRQRFGYGLQRGLPGGLDLDAEQQERVFTRKEMVLLIDGGFTTSRVYAVAALPKTGELLVLGPVRLSDNFPYALAFLGVVVALVMMGFAAYVIVRPLEHRLNLLEDVVARVRRGDLSTRMEIHEHDPLGHLGVAFNDMAEHIQRLLASQQEMVRAVSHELRTPVARIRFGVEMLQDAVSDEMREQQFEGLDHDIEELDKLIDEILTYSKLEGGQPQLDFKLIDIDALLRRVKRETDGLGKGIEVEYISPNLPLERRLAEGEERYIHRVVQNFVGNALRYANSKVRVSFGMVGDVFRIDVEDDGPGVPKEDRNRVFTPFTRLDDSRTRASGGYGLGLSIVQRIAYWHGGKARVSASTLGGAKFTIIWPRSQALREASDGEGT